MEGATELLNNQVTKLFSQYGLVIACLFVGFIFGFSFKTYIVDWKKDKLVKDRFIDKDEYINSLKRIVYERLSVEPELIDKSFFKRLKSFFKVSVKSVRIKKK